MKSVDPYFSRVFNSESYNCLHFTREVWKDATGEDLGERLDGLFVPPSQRRIKSKHSRAFMRLSKPLDPCLVLMQRDNCDPHVGVYIRGSVLHITELGVEYQPVDVASRGFMSVRFYV